MNSRNESTVTKTKKAELQKLDVDDTILIDGCFTVDKARWGTWRSFDSEGKEIITALTEEQCISATRWYLKASQEGFEETPTHEGTVGGKL
jgi:hypothetical protein